MYGKIFGVDFRCGFSILLVCVVRVKLFGCVGESFRVVCFNKGSMSHLTNANCQRPVGQGSSRSTARIAGQPRLGTTFFFFNVILDVPTWTLGINRSYRYILFWVNYISKFLIKYQITIKTGTQ